MRDGLQMGKSCLTNLIPLYNNMTLLVDARRLVNVNKAFVSVHHNILSDKLIKYHLGKWAVKWSEDCLH